MRKTQVLLLCIVLLGALCGQAQPLQQRAPQAQPVSPPAFRFAVIGDTGTGDSHEYQVAAKVASARTYFPFELVLMVGDNIYGSDGAKDFVTKFEKPYKALLETGMKFYAALGNHDEPEVQKTYK